jgi:hypothetical protein
VTPSVTRDGRSRTDTRLLSAFSRAAISTSVSRTSESSIALIRSPHSIRQRQQLARLRDTQIPEINQICYAESSPEVTTVFDFGSWALMKKEPNVPGNYDLHIAYGICFNGP